MLHSLARTCRTTAGLCRHPPSDGRAGKESCPVRGIRTIFALAQWLGSIEQSAHGSSTCLEVCKPADLVPLVGGLINSILEMLRLPKISQDIQIQTSSGHHHCLASYQITQA